MLAPNTRVQRTRSSPSALRSPLTRHPLGRRTVLVVALTVVVGCTYSRDGLKKAELRLAGPAALDCGGVQPGGNPQPVDRCAVEAFRAGRPFLATYYNESMDSTSAIVLVGKAGGGAARLYYDSAPCGGPHCPERIVERPCVNPYVVQIDSGERVTCE